MEPRRRQRLGLHGGGRRRGRTGYHHSRGHGAYPLVVVGEGSSYVSLGCVSTGASPDSSEAVVGMEALHQPAHYTSPLDMARKVPRCPEPFIIIPQDRGSAPWCGDGEGRRIVDSLVVGTADRWIGAAAAGAQMANSWVTSSQFVENLQIRRLAAEFTESYSEEYRSRVWLSDCF